MIPVTFFSFLDPSSDLPTSGGFVPVEERSDSAPLHSGFPTLKALPSVSRVLLILVVLFCRWSLCVLCPSAFTYHLFQDQLNLELRDVLGGGSLSCLRLFSLDRGCFRRME